MRPFKRFIVDMLAGHPKIKPVAQEAFGGRIRFLGFTVMDNRDKDKIRMWAEEVGRKFTE